jgi:hypothetical protein
MRILVGLVVLLGTLRSAHAESYVEEHTRYVKNSFVLFAPAAPPERQANAVELERDKDRLRLLQPLDPRATLQQTGYGFAMFGAATFVAAHAPDRLRKILSGPLRLGPALFEAGGMGAGIIGLFL